MRAREGAVTAPSLYPMKKLAPYAVLVILAGLALIPPIDWFIKNPYNDKWLWMITVSGFLGFLTLMVKTSWYVRIIAMVGFLNCFFSVIPYLSFTAYVVLIGCCWFYILCEQVEDWTIVFKAVQAVVLLNVFFMIMQSIHQDPLLNFGTGKSIEQYGIIGHHMLMGSFSVVASAFLLSFNPWNIIFPFMVSIICTSTWSFFCATVGLFLILYTKLAKHSSHLYLAFVCLFAAFLLWSYHEGKFFANLESKSGRGYVWSKTFDLSTGKPWLGWGIGSYKDVFPALAVQPEHFLQYRNAHNFILQLCFEVGFVLTAIIVIGLIYFIWEVLTHGLYAQAAGLIMVFLDGMVHFPDRVTQCVPIIIALIAYSAHCIKGRYKHARSK